MPTYSYRCSNEECKTEFDVVQRMSDDKLVHCEKCDKETLERIITAQGGFALKGKGWFGNSKTTKGY